MKFPTFEDILLPLLKVTKAEKEYNTERAIRYIAKIYNLTEEEKTMEYSCGKVLRELVRFGRDYLRGSGLIKGYNKNFSITKEGVLILKDKPKSITREMLKSIPSYNAYIKEINNEAKVNAQFYEENNLKNSKENLLDLERFIAEYNLNNKKSKSVKGRSSAIKLRKELDLLFIEDEIAQKHKELDDKLKCDLLAKVKSLAAREFEELVLEVIFRLIYENPNGLKPKDVIKNVGKTGDGGIDGIITKRDKLKETKIYVQAKCWKDTTISRPEIQKFVGALAGQKAKDGIYITTSKFANTALEYVKESSYHINLIDGEELINYMIEFEIGVQQIAHYKVKVIDTEYFMNYKRIKLD